MTSAPGLMSSPWVFIPTLMATIGLVVALNRINVWYPVAVLAICAAGMLIVALVRRRATTKDRGGAHVDYGRLGRLQPRALAPWIKQNLRGHDAVVDSVLADIERNLSLARPGRTLGAFILVGPTGTGKTFLAQLIAQGLYPDTQPVLLRLNQLKHAEDVFTLLGPPPGMHGYEVGGALTRPVLENPHRVVILDEIEKMHRDLQHCLYDVIDAASCIEKSSGRRVDFSGCVFFATSNAGVEALRALRESGVEPAPLLGRARDALVDAGGFDRAFLARWDAIHFMDELPAVHVAEVACLQLARQWRDYNIEVQYASPRLLLEAVQRNAEFRAYGVRQLAAYLQVTTRDAIAEARRTGATSVRLDVAADGRLVIHPTALRT